MKTIIRRIGLLSEREGPREVKFTSGLNIVTGDSKTGKSALIEIADYCLFSSRSTVPFGVISNFADFYYLSLEGNDVTITIIRPSWRSDQRNRAALIVTKSEPALEMLGMEDIEEVHFRPYKEAQVELERLLGLSVGDTRESEGESKSLAGRASLRSMSSLLFQHQNLVANKHSLFYRFDDTTERQKTVDQFPIFLGWATGEYYFLKQRLEELRGQRAQILKENDRLARLRADQTDRLKSPLEMYFRALGTTLPENLTFEKLVETARNLPEPNYLAEASSNVDRQLIEISNRIEECRSLLKQVESQIGESQPSVELTGSYGDQLDLLAKKLNMAEQVGDLVCPVCSQKTSTANITVSKITSARSHILDEYRGLSKYGHDLGPYLRELFLERDRLKRELRQLSINRISLESIESSEESKRQNLRESLARLQGRMDIILNDEVHRLSMSRYSEDYSQIDKEIRELEQRVKGFGIVDKIHEASASISTWMTRISERLDFEDELRGGRFVFDASTFELSFTAPDSSKIRLSEMGSGANWLATHLSLFLSLLRLNVVQPGSMIPTTLLIDQPSQVYFPKVQAIIRPDDPVGTDEATGKEYDENIRQVINLFEVIKDEIDSIEKDTGLRPQVIVMDHADEPQFYEYVRARWTNDGEKLV